MAGYMAGHGLLWPAMASHHRRKKEHYFKSWMGPGPNSDQIREIGPEWALEMKQNIGNPYQTEDNKGRLRRPPRGRRFAPPPWVLLSAIW